VFSTAGRAAVLLLAIALLLRLVMAWSNYGFVAMDDYLEMLRLAVPAQTVAGPAAVIETADIRSPLPKLAVYGLGQLGLRLGVDAPVNQVRFIYIVLSLLSFAAVAVVGWMFFRLGRSDWALHGIAWTGLHFLAVYVSTRALIENLSLPFFTVAVVLLVLYATEGRRSWLLLSLLALTFASLARFQVGIALIALIAVPAIRRAWRDLAVVLSLGLALFLITGWIDFLLRGSFHHSLRVYFAFNASYSSTFGVTDWYAYLVLLVAVSLPPLFVGRYRGFPWREYGQKLWPLVLAVGVFVAVHSAIPHKEDRFLVPVHAAYFALLAPLSAFLTRHRVLGWRSVTFVVINAALIWLIAAVPAQNNIIGVAKYLGEHPEYRTLWSLRSEAEPYSSAEPYVEAYSAGPTPPLHAVTIIPNDSVAVGRCEDVLAVRSDFIDQFREELTGWSEVAVFGPGLPERAVILINPTHNTRRNPVHLFVPEGCALPR
jgi:hypothetical protein